MSYFTVFHSSLVEKVESMTIMTGKKDLFEKEKLIMTSVMNLSQ